MVEWVLEALEDLWCFRQSEHKKIITFGTPPYCFYWWRVTEWAKFFIRLVQCCHTFNLKCNNSTITFVTYQWLQSWFVNRLPMVLSEYSGFPHQKNWLPQYNWNIVEIGVKHHYPNPGTNVNSFVWALETV